MERWLVWSSAFRRFERLGPAEAGTPSCQRFHGPNADSRSAEHALQVLRASGRDLFRSFVEIEHFHRDATVITDFLQRGGNRLEIDIAEARAFQILVIGMEVGEMGPGIANDLRNG